MKKYEFTDETKDLYDCKLTRIRALIDFGDVKAGSLGGFIEKESNLSHNGNAWVSGDASVHGNAKIYGNAEVSGDAEVSGNAWVSGDADYICIKGLGRSNRNTTFFKTKHGVSVVCGCFSGTLEEFEAKVVETHGNSIYAKEYLAAVEVVKIHFGIAEKI